MKRKFYLTILLLICSVTFLFAQGVNYRGTSAVNFLKIGMGAKLVGIAESDITFSQDASSLFWNPGAISRINNTSAVFSYSTWLVETNLTYFAFTLPTEFGTAGLDVTYFSSGDIEETTLEKQEGTGRVVSANDLSIGLAFAKNLTDRFSVGLKVKYIREQLVSVTADAFAFDIGSVFETSFLNNMKLGISLSNFGSQMQFDGNDLLVTHVVPGSPTNKQIPAILQTNEWNLPLFFRIGLATNAFEFENYKLAVSYAITDSRDYETRHNLGAAFTFMDVLTLRGGYRFNYDEATFSAGLGVAIPSDFMGKVMFDYAYTDFGELKDIHQLTVGLNF